MKFSSEVRYEVAIKEALLLLPIDFPQLICFMKRGLDSRCLQGERCVPRSSFWPTETISMRIGMSERGVDYFRGEWIEIGRIFTYVVKSESVVKIAHARLIATAQRRMSTIETTIPFPLHRLPALAASS
jgi:hypothetical protein